MGKCWDGEYAFEKGEEVEVKKGRPFAGRKGIVNTAMGSEQFGVLLSRRGWHEGQEVTFFADSLQLLPIAEDRRAKERLGHKALEALREGEVDDLPGV